MLQKNPSLPANVPISRRSPQTLHLRRGSGDPPYNVSVFGHTIARPIEDDAATSPITFDTGFLDWVDPTDCLIAILDHLRTLQSKALEGGETRRSALTEWNAYTALGSVLQLHRGDAFKGEDNESRLQEFSGLLKEATREWIRACCNECFFTDPVCDHSTVPCKDPECSGERGGVTRNLLGDLFG